jgi:hypothetical protein
MARIAAAIALILLGPSPAIAGDTGLSGARIDIARIDKEQARAELARAQAAKKTASEEKGKAYLDAHRLYKNCERDLRPFCMMSSQMIMRNADARYRNRERQEFSNLAALEAAIAAADVAPAAMGGCGTSECSKASQ